MCKNQNYSWFHCIVHPIIKGEIYYLINYFKHCKHWVFHLVFFSLNRKIRPVDRSFVLFDKKVIASGKMFTSQKSAMC